MAARFINYWKNNFALGAQRSWKWLGCWGKIMDLIIAVAVGYLVSQDDLVKFGVVSVLVAFTMYCLITITFAVFIVPFQESAKLESENESQRKQISRFVKKFQREKVKTTRIEIIPREDFPHRDHEDQYYYAYLEISNGEDSDLLDCYANLTSLSIKIPGTQEWGNYLDWVTGGGTNELVFPKFDIKEQKRVRRKNIERIDIAKWKVGGQPTFIFADGKQESTPEKRIYIEVSLNGEINKNGRLVAIEELKFCGFLTWYQGSYTQEGATETTTINGVTTTEIEPPKELPYYRFYLKPGELKDEKENLS